MYVDANVPVTPKLLAEGALLLAPDGVVSHHTALQLWGGAGPVSSELHVSVRHDPRRARPRVSGLRVHEVQELDCATVAGLPLTTPARTFLDLAAWCDLTDLVAAGDSLVRRTGATPESLYDAASSTIGVRGVRLARQAAGLVRSGVDSPMESRLRLLIVLAGLPEPEIGRTIYDADGGWLAKPDLSYPDLRIAIEYDGRHHLRDSIQWQRDIRRRENLERAGWLVRVITAADLLRAPDTVLARITQDIHTRLAA
ncbi:hypothetical protein EV646_111338 [Kribbella antiqua]|uniref:DUF559 domain-containing protein n=1 Tax=Kribbella antiqua TaxID=2512217 RepID=A0A4R2IH74_9ACTN|nr:hypothetical protein [Kribbella antiqua]TCO44144.1 hypothetical protein EV646_111338 [Kribbella antiqua]